MLEDRGALPKEDGNQLRECNAMHKENVVSSWLREDVEGEKQKWRSGRKKPNKSKVKMGKQRWREEDRMVIKRR